MALKPSECFGIPNSTYHMIDRLESRVDESLSAQYNCRGRDQEPVRVNSGIALDSIMKKLLEARYLDWHITYEIHESSNETVAIFTARDSASAEGVKNGKQRQ